MRNRRTNLSRASYIDPNDYARDLLRSGGPDLGDLDSLGGTGGYCELLRAIWGASRTEFDTAIAYEQDLEQRRRRHIFVRKIQTRYPPRQRRHGR